MDFQKGYLKLHLPPSLHTWDRLRWRGRCDRTASYCSRDRHGERATETKRWVVSALNLVNLCHTGAPLDYQSNVAWAVWALKKSVSDGTEGNSWFLPMKHLSHFVKAAQRKQHQDGFGFLVDLWGAQVFRPALQNIRALSRAQTHLETNTPMKRLKTTPECYKMIVLFYSFECTGTLASQAARFHSP